MPQSGGILRQEEPFEFTAAVSLGEETGLQDLGIVKHEAITGFQEVGYSAEPAVSEPTV